MLIFYANSLFLGAAQNFLTKIENCLLIQQEGRPLPGRQKQK